MGAASATLAEAWDGTSWSVQPTPSPAHAVAAEFDGVSCVSAMTCTAVGQYNNAAGSALTLAAARS